jgi:hypothetical protein
LPWAIGENKVRVWRRCNTKAFIYHAVGGDGRPVTIIMRILTGKAVISGGFLEEMLEEDVLDVEILSGFLF